MIAKLEAHSGDDKLTPAAGSAGGVPALGRNGSSKQGGYQIYAPTAQGTSTDFHEAAERGDRKYIIATLERSLDFNVNVKDKHGRTALHWAVECQQHSTVECLLDYRADPLVLEYSGRNCFFLAAKNNDTRMLDLLSEEVEPEDLRAAICAADGSGLTPISVCRERQEERTQALQWLAAHGAVFDATQMYKTFNLATATSA